MQSDGLLLTKNKQTKPKLPRRGKTRQLATRLGRAGQGRAGQGRAGQGTTREDTDTGLQTQGDYKGSK